MKIRVGIPLIQDELTGDTGWIAGFYFIKNCLNALATLPAEEVPEVYVFVRTNFKEPLLLPEYANNVPWLNIIKVPEGMMLADHGKYDRLQNHINSYSCQLFFPFLTTPKFSFNGSWLGWIPDFQDRHLPQFFSEQERDTRKLMCDFIMGYCEKIFCSSKSVYIDLIKFYPECKSKGVVLPFSSVLSVNCLNKNPQTVLDRYGITQKYIYLPNQFWVHKNHKLVFEAWRELKHKGCNYLLVCTGSNEDYRFPGYYQELQTYLADNKLTENIRILGFLDRDDQIQLYRGASAVLQPSLFEGWSTSLEDAKALGKTIIVSDIPVHHEQCGADAYYFSSSEPTALAHIIQSIWDQLSGGHEPDRERAAVLVTQTQIQSFARGLIKAFYSFTTVNLASIKSKNLLLGLLIELNVDRASRLQQLKESNCDREARLQQITKLTQWLEESNADRELRLQQITNLTQQLEESNADREARLQQITQLTQQLEESNTDREARQQQNNELTSLLKESELDRAARLEQIEILAQKLQESEKDREARQQQNNELTSLLKESELDRAARLEQIEILTQKLQESEQDREARQQQNNDLTNLLKESELDRAARLGVITKLTQQLEESELDRAARFDVIMKLTQQLQEYETAHSKKLTTRLIKFSKKFKIISMYSKSI